MTFKYFDPYYGVFHQIEIATLILFTIEYILRIYTSDLLYPDKTKGKAVIKFLLSFDGIVDLLTILPLVPFAGFVAFRILRVVRIFHLFRINATYDSFNVIAQVISEKKKQIASSVLIIFIFMLASSLGMYSAEHDTQPEAFANAFSGIWWSVSALLTVGYGDIYPMTVWGKILGIFVAFLGVGLVAIPTGIISAGFVEQYNLSTSMGKKMIDTGSIGETLIDNKSEFAGKSIREITKDKTVEVLLVIRDDLHIVPTPTLVLKPKDIVVIKSDRVEK
jgi:voltage-gated potassium channel